MVQTLLSIAGYFAVGFIEMFLATQRTYWISKGRSRAAALLVFFENLIAFYVIAHIASDLNHNLTPLVIYSIGNSIGTYINLEKVAF